MRSQCQEREVSSLPSSTHLHGTMPPPGDSRLLKNLLKAEQAAQDS